MKIKIKMQNQERDFEVTRMAYLGDLIYVGRYSQGFGGIAYLDMPSGKVVLVPNELVETESCPIDIKTVKASKGDRVLVVKPAEPLDLRISAVTHWGVFPGENEWRYGNPGAEKKIKERKANEAEETQAETAEENSQAQSADEAF